MLQNATLLAQKGATEYSCELCDYKCSKYFNLERHNSTAKHQNAIKCYTNAIQTSKTEPTKKYSCPNCNKDFSHSSSMYRHKKLCIENQQLVSSEKNLEDKSLENKILDIFSKQTDKMLEIIKEGTHNTTNNKMINSHNTNTNTNNFNLQFYLPP